MDAQCVIDTALSAGAANLGAPEAAKIFRDNVNSSLRCNVTLTSAQKSILRKSVSFPILFTGGKNVTNDHPVLVACRDLIRDIFEQEHKIQQTTERTLIVGASAREIRRYNVNPHIHFYVYGKENKDYDRTIRPALSDICKMLKTKAGKQNRTVFLNHPDEIDTTTTRGVVKRYWQAKEIFEDYCTSHKLPNTIHTDIIPANTLVFEDSFYNFSWPDYCDIFTRTGAEIAYGYGLLPLELIFPDMPDNPLYTIRTWKDSNGVSLTSLVYRHGYANGYVHETEKWATILKKPAYNTKQGLSLAVEITSRVGPMVSFKIYRCRNPEKVVRCFELDDRQRYVKLLDVKASISKTTGRVNSPLSYFSMSESEYLDVVNYLMSLDLKSLSYQNTIAYIRRRMGGMSLITKELVEPWILPKRRVADAALTIFMDVKLRTDLVNKTIENIAIGSISEKFIALFKQVGRAVVYPLTLIYDWIIAGHLIDKLVLDGQDMCYQYSFVNPKPESFKEKEFDVGLFLDNPYEGDIPSCPVCSSLMGKLGEQIIDCNHIETEPITIGLNDQQLANLKTSLIDTDNDPPGLANVKKRCHDNLPTAGFEIKVNFRYIKAGPGCGKSYLIRQLADEHDLVLAPFTKLRPDYVNILGENNERYDLLFKTTHRAMESTGCRRIFVDEFTSFPFEYLCCIAWKNGAEEIYLVGDDKQTRVKEPDEGMYIGNHIQLDKISTHELLVNFRNPQDTVALLNKVYGYKMRAHSKIEKSIEFITPDQVDQQVPAVHMAFSKISAKNNTEEEKNTVRANQGGTHKSVVLYCTIADGSTPSVESLQIVGLSRHTEKLYIVTDNCDQGVQLKQKLALDADFYEHMQTWLTFPNETLKEVIQEDKMVSMILKPTQPPRDMYLLHETFVPSIAHDDISTSMNLISSSLVPDGWVTGNFNPDLLIMPVNKRKHPINLSVQYYSLSQGVGNHFSSKSPIQVLQVLQARYFNKQVFCEFGFKQKALAAKMVNSWFNRNVQPNFRKNLFDDAEVQIVINEFLNKVTSSAYQSAFKANGGLENPDARTIRFNLKNIFKPKHGEPDVYKAGQGISAWSTDACAMFCSVFRVLSRLIVKTEKTNIITDSYMSESEFILTCKNQLSLINDTADFATTDGVTFDANQNAFTQLIEKLYWSAYGVSEEFLDMYYSFRKNYRVISSVAIGFAGTQKTSGEPGTLANNGVVSKVYSDYVVKEDGPYVLIYKGDDFTKKGYNLTIDYTRMDEVKTACSLGLRVNIGKSTEFCGLTFAGGQLYPSIPRKVNKISAHRFKNYKHFAEYQQSLRNWVDLVTEQGEFAVVTCNADHYKTSYTEMQDAFDFVKSVSHIDEAQFFQQFLKRTETSVIPVLTNHGNDFIEQK